MIEAEKSVLGACFLEPEALDLALAKLTSEDFSLEGHRRTFDAMRRLVDDRQPVDLVSVNLSLRESGHLETAGGPGYLGDLVDFVPTAANVGFYLESVKKASTRRQLLEIAENMQFRLEEEPDPSAVIEEAESRLFSLRETGAQGGPVPVSQGAVAVLESWEVAGLTPGLVSGLRTGFPRLDIFSGGLEPGRLYLLGARPGVGKTAFLLAIAAAVSVRDRLPSIFFSLEMAHDQLAGRLLTSLASVDGARARIGRLEIAEFDRLTAASEKLRTAPFFIDDSPALLVSEIRARARRMKRREGIRLIFVDYLQLVRAAVSKGASRENEVAAISRQLKALARELSVPVLAAVQLNRGLENRIDKRPMLADLRESGSLEQDADQVWFLHRPGVFDPDADQGDVDLLIAKNRSGPLGKVPLRFHPESCKFSPASVPGQKAKTQDEGLFEKRREG
jgi:replicative DNA helicase